MCVRFLPGDLTSDPYLSHLTNTYTCGVTITPRVCGGKKHLSLYLRTKREKHKGKILLHTYMHLYTVKIYRTENVILNHIFNYIFDSV